MTRLRQRMIEDMEMRNLSPETIKGYLFQVSRFAKHFNQSPDLPWPRAGWGSTRSGSIKSICFERGRWLPPP